MLDPATLVVLAARLVDDASFVGDRLESAHRFAVDQAAWKDLVPFAHIDDAIRPVRTTPITDTEIEAQFRSYREDGWFAFPGLFDVEAIAIRRRIVETLVANDWLPVFAFIFDEFWDVARAPVAHGILEGILGPGYRMSLDVWAHLVPARRGAAGWPAHVDSGIGETSARLAIWIPTTEATLSNGCMYLIPRSRLSREVADSFKEGTPLETVRWRDLLQGVRALPAPAGSFMGWDGGVLHWGSAWSAGPPRLSFALEYFSAEKAIAQGTPGIDPIGPLPDFATRLRAIGHAIRNYRSFEQRVARFVPLAERLITR